MIKKRQTQADFKRDIYNLIPDHYTFTAEIHRIMRVREFFEKYLRSLDVGKQKEVAPVLFAGVDISREGDLAVQTPSWQDGPLIKLTRTVAQCCTACNDAMIDISTQCPGSDEVTVCDICPSDAAALLSDETLLKAAHSNYVELCECACE